MPYDEALFITGVFVFTALASVGVLWINVLPWGAGVVVHLSLLQANIIFLSLVVTPNCRRLTSLMPRLIAMAVWGWALFMNWMRRSAPMFLKQIQPFLPHFTKVSAEGSSRT